MEDAEATAPLNGHVPAPTQQARPSNPCSRRSAALVLVLTLIVLPVWLVVAVYEVNFLKLRPQATLSNLRGEDTASNAPEASMLKLHPHIAGDSDTSAVSRLLEMGNDVLAQQGAAVYPEAIYAVDWSTQVSRHDVLHLGALQRACMEHRESAIPWTFGRADATEPWPNALLNRTMDEEKLLAALKQCPPVDVYIPTSLRGQGYCEDATAYTKYLRGRMIPHWVLEIELFDKQANRKVRYHELCPRTPILLFNHYWDDVRADPKYPSSKPLYLMPNIEMYELEANHYWQVDVILCKTVVCTEYINKWYEQVGNPRMTEVIYTRFTTSDMATNALVAAGDESADSGWSERPKNFETPVFVHTAGSSAHKGSRFVLDCWLSRPDLPQLDFYIGGGNYDVYRNDYDQRIKNSPNIKLHVGSIDAIPFGKMIAETSFFLCASVMEGYGHYINHARASGGLVVSSDVAPMNELVTPSSGVLLKATTASHRGHYLGGHSPKDLSLRGVKGYVASFGGSAVCAAVDEVLKNLSADERRRRAHRVRQQFFYDTAFFARKMQQLRKLLGFKEARARRLSASP